MNQNESNRKALPYDRTILDIGRLRRYAKRVAAETKSAPMPDIFRQVTKSIPTTETRSYGFLGLRTKEVRATKTTQVNERVIGPHWVLHSTNHHIEQHRSGNFIEYFELNYWVLHHDGVLLKVWQWEEATRFKDGTVRVERDCTAKPMTEEDILRRDYADQRYEKGTSGRGTKYWGDRDPGCRVRHAKGVGLSVALKNLLG